MVSGRRRGKRRDLHRDRVNQQPGAGPPAERRASGPRSFPKSTVIAGNPEVSLRPGSRMTATIRDLATACHAEGRGFESHQPLRISPLAERVFLFLELISALPRKRFSVPDRSPAIEIAAKQRAYTRKPQARRGFVPRLDS